MEPLAAAGLPDIIPAGVEPARGGYVMLNIDRSPALVNLHEAILDIAAQARDSLGADPFGSPYIRDSFTPHISLAKLDRDDQAEATAIGKRTLANTSSTRSQALELCDIGENSERWEILASFTAATAPPPEGDSTPLTG
jgi:hypothetical protein